MNGYNLGAGAAATDIIYPQEHLPHQQQQQQQQHPNASELLREYVDKVGAQQQLQHDQQQPATGEFPSAANKTANFSVSHLLDLEELPRENCAMFATATALDGNAGVGGGMTTDGVALRLQRPSDASSPMDSACCGLPGNAGAIGSQSPPDEAQTPHKQLSGKSCLLSLAALSYAERWPLWGDFRPDFQTFILFLYSIAFKSGSFLLNT